MTIKADGKVELPIIFENDRKAGIKVRSDRMDMQFKSVTDAIDYQLDRYGRKPMLDNLNMNGKKISNLSPGESDGDAATISQIRKIERTQATEDTPGCVILASPNEGVIGTNHEHVMTPLTTRKAIESAYMDLSNKLPLNYFSGFNLSVKDAKTITVSIGQARDKNDRGNIILTEPKAQKITDILAKDLQIMPNKKYYVFALSSAFVDATRGYFLTPSLTNNLQNFRQVSDGNIRITVNGVARELTHLNLTAIKTLSDLAELINSFLPNCIVQIEHDKLKITSSLKGASSIVNLSAVAGISGENLSSPDYFNSSSGLSVPGKDANKQNFSLAIDDNIDGKNLFLTDWVKNSFLYLYRLVGYISTNDKGQLTDSATTENFTPAALSQYFKNIVTLWTTPDYSLAKLVTLSELEKGFTAPANGMLIGRLDPMDTLTAGVYINNIMVAGMHKYFFQVSIPVAKGTVITVKEMDDNPDCEVYFIPYHGAN